MIKPVTVYGNPVLRKECEDIEQNRTYHGYTEEKQKKVTTIPYQNKKMSDKQVHFILSDSNYVD